MTTLEQYFAGEREGYFYREKTFVGTDEEYVEAKKNSSTVFISNIPISVREERIWELFLLCGEVKRVIMGLNRNTLRFCGFCFVEFYTVHSADMAVKYINGFRLDQSPLSIDKDYGFVDGRQYGRGVFGGRVKVDKMYLEDRHQRDGTKRRRQGKFLR
ncbi:putative RNA-binding protein [Encephalitozoon romaleae SJ-2008]|uniref:Nuclear cap-binding protein subunit 2 n=1 Tax=Encephalitozoon romaleae (strain SJ-2008) TaxID=1178016 RepID=I7ADN8_ENCRO|nr:putative RNA-binding protein [Encephalitozoon romaleae SJ-2008]AFN82685.1 putative RNA-binding protein [Encephalitozoon romaleae SJ-2008]